MKKLLFVALFASTGTLLAQSPGATPNPKTPPPVLKAPARSSSTETFVYDQKPLGGQPALVSPDQARTIIDRFKEAYGKMGNPRLLIYVNRELVDEKTGMKLIARTEKTEVSRKQIDSTVDAHGRASNSVTINAGGNVTVNGSEIDAPGQGKISTSGENTSSENRYRLEEKDRKFADRQTVRDMERLFGRPLRTAGATLTDQNIATQLMADRPGRSLTANTATEAARKDRAALAKVADVVIEILISSRNLHVAEISGNKTQTVPDIQATATRLKDSEIIGQASSRDVLGKDRYAGQAARNFDVLDVTEATALALMDDMATGVK